MKNSDTPLSVKIEDDQLVIHIGIDRLDGHDCHPIFPELPITNRQQWGQDVAAALQSDRGDGSTPISLLLDEAMKSAIETGSQAIDYKCPTVRDIDGNPTLYEFLASPREHQAIIGLTKMQIQAASDAAFCEANRELNPYLVTDPRLPVWPEEAPNRLAIAIEILAALHVTAHPTPPQNHESTH